MAAVTSAVIGGITAAVSIKNSRDAKKAQERAADKSTAANIAGAQQLAAATQEAQSELAAGGREALTLSAEAARLAEEQILPFVEPGTEAFRQVQELILSGGTAQGPLADEIRAKALEAVQQRGVFNIGGIQPELERQADLAVSQLTPDIRGQLLTAATQGISAVGDVSQIRSRGQQTLADIVGGVASQRASLLVGQTPALVQLSQGAQESRLLGGVAGQQSRANIAGTLANLGGQLTAPGAVFG